MANPTINAVDAANATIAAANGVILAACAGAFDAVTAANVDAIAKLDAALAQYPSLESEAANMVRGWRNQLQAFSSTFDTLSKQLAAAAPSTDPAA